MTTHNISSYTIKYRFPLYNYIIFSLVYTHVYLYRYIYTPWPLPPLSSWPISYTTIYLYISHHRCAHTTYLHYIPIHLSSRPFQPGSDSYRQALLQHVPFTLVQLNNTNSHQHDSQVSHSDLQFYFQHKGTQSITPQIGIQRGDATQSYVLNMDI